MKYSSIDFLMDKELNMFCFSWELQLPFNDHLNNFTKDINISVKLEIKAKIYNQSSDDNLDKLH